MNYDVLEESKHAIKNLEQNAWKNHKEEYVNAKGAIEEFQDRIDTEEYNISKATTEEEVSIAQEELTKIIDDILKFNDDFNSSMITIDTNNEVLDPSDNFEINPQAIDEFLANMSE